MGLRIFILLQQGSLRLDAAKDDGKFVVDLLFKFLGAGQVGLVPRAEVVFLGRPHVADEDGETGSLLRRGFL